MNRLKPRRLPALAMKALLAATLCGPLAGMMATAAAGSAAATGPTASGAPQPLPAGTHELQVAHGGLLRKVVVHIPATLLAPAPQPQGAALVLAFHGGGGHAEFMADDARYGLIRAAEKAPYVVAFPNGYSRLPRGRLATWNAGGCCGDARDRQIDDVGFARAVVAAVQARVKVNPACPTAG